MTTSTASDAGAIASGKKPIRFGSVCSGIEAASVAFGPVGWTAAWFSEIEQFPSAVLSYHYPSVPNHGDMTTLPERIASGEVEAPDVLCGGTPCQAFSLAGQRRSLDDARGNLSLTFCEIADAIDAVRSIRGDNPDGPRYKSLGNSWCVDNVRWIGYRMQAANDARERGEDR